MVDRENSKILCAKRLKECRLEHNYTLEDIGKKVGVAKSTILRWENGSVDKIRSSTIEYLSELYSVSPIWLMGLSNQKNLEVKKKILDLSDFSDEDFDFICKQVEYMRWKMNKKE